MKKSTKKIAIALSVFMCLQPVMFAVDSDLNKDIVALELELTKMKARAGEYADMSEEALNRKIDRTKKTLEKKREQAKKEAKKDTQTFKKGVKKAGNDIKDAGKEIGNTFKDIFN